MNIRSFLFRLTHWEYWPTFMFYVPHIPFIIYKIIRVGNPIYILTANPSILYSGCGTESKYHTISMIPIEYRPKTILIPINSQFDDIIKLIHQENISFPLIVKPDKGFRGYLVKKIDDEKELKLYFSKIDLPIIIQEFIDYENEIGIFYHRIPGDTKGKITSITIKKYLTITGNGINTLSELILKDSRAFLYYNLMKNIHQKRMDEIILHDKKITLSVIGNHSKGTQFINGNKLINRDLENMFDTLSHQIKGWHYGRVDLKYISFDSLCKGNDFKIIEINGIISEPTHIYDPTTGANYFDALKSIKDHWKILSEIALINHKEYEIPYPKFYPFVQHLKQLKKQSKNLKKLNEI